MDWVRANWKWLLAVTVVAFVTIGLTFADYTKLQTADDADVFRRVLGDDRGRAIVANLCDMVFAASYGVLGILAFRSLDPTRRGTVGAMLIAGGAIADEIENVFVFRNIVGSDSTTDGWIDTMRTIGTIKTTLLFLSLGALAGALLLRAINSRRQKPSS